MLFHEYLEGLMQARRVPSHRALAERAGVTPSAVSRWLAGQSVPEPEQCRALAEYFKRPQVEVFVAAGHITKLEGDAPLGPEEAELLRVLPVLTTPFDTLAATW